jgi:hypothetical protein
LSKIEKNKIRFKICSKNGKCVEVTYELIEKLSNQTTSSEESTCAPNWQCQQWQPSADGVCSGETFTQNCAQWIDLNNCGINETPTTTLSVVNGDAERPTTQETTGTKDCSASSTQSTSTTSP